ncbi:WG repeat-containing protein [Holdemania massiliensis]|uniref:WG repeat-containing protein n=1 Tax=Holdemania massiliensis TaxID=1468449 RepID=UPI001F0621F3|nr:WG repeat-containing protein [Holdemania massiliensis]MCH1942406.1 WG repeat-containing protein [Holdemania massiliensis]
MKLFVLKGLFLLLSLTLFSGCHVLDSQPEYSAVHGQTETKQELVSVYDQLKTINLKDEKRFAKAYENGQYGVIDRTGKLVVPAEYDQVLILNDGRVLGIKDEQYTLYNTEWIPMNLTEVNHQVQKWDSVHFDLTLNLFEVEKEGKFTLMDLNGVLLTERFYDVIQSVSCLTPSEGQISPVFLAANRKNQEYNVDVYNLSGQLITPESYRQAAEDGYFDVVYSQIKSGEYMVSIKNDNVYDGYDLEGKRLFNDASDVSFEYSIHTVIAEKNGKYAILDKLTEAADFEYDNIQFYDEKSVIVTQNGKSGILDADGNFILPLKYDEVLYLYGLPELTEFNVKMDGQRQVIDSNGKVLFEHNCDELFKEGDYYEMRRIGGTMDNQGNVISPNIILYRYNGFDRYTGICSGAPCLLDEKMEIIKRFPSLDWISTSCYGTQCSKNYFPFLKESIHYGIMDSQGEILAENIEIEQWGWITIIKTEDKVICATDAKTIELPSEKASDVYPAKIQGQFGIFIGEANKLVFYNDEFELQFEAAADRIVGEHDAFEAEDGTIFRMFVVERDDKKGIMLETGEMILEPIYEDILYFNHTEYGLAKMQGKGAVFNFRGDWISDFVYSWDENFEIQENRILGNWYSCSVDGDPLVYQRNQAISGCKWDF